MPSPWDIGTLLDSWGWVRSGKMVSPWALGLFYREASNRPIFVFYVNWVNRVNRVNRVSRVSRVFCQSGGDRGFLDIKNTGPTTQPDVGAIRAVARPGQSSQAY
ncbi:hypothetical protein BCR42DRAFT_396906 [Absidia repens]|uniref:Uncharacterized protein n=1 Tax=Absidia repens TaxID=90262 RepID=A0A1X2I2Q5_9FUNG|nr:hypothetical protein BCR42DRAFT_396906 [Absidia repens]